MMLIFDYSEMGIQWTVSTEELVAQRESTHSQQLSTIKRGHNMKG